MSRRVFVRVWLVLRAVLAAGLGVLIGTVQAPRLAAAIAAADVWAAVVSLLVALAAGLGIAGLLTWLATDVARGWRPTAPAGLVARGWRARLAVAARTVGWWLLMCLGLAVVSGLLAVVIMVTVGRGHDLEFVRRLVDVVVVVLALAASPVAFAGVVLGLIGVTPVSRAGRAQIQRVYAPVALVLVVAAVVGFGAWAALGNLAGPVGAALRLALVVAVGAVAQVVAVRQVVARPPILGDSRGGWGVRTERRPRVAGRRWSRGPLIGVATAIGLAVVAGVSPTVSRAAPVASVPETVATEAPVSLGEPTTTVPAPTPTVTPTALRDPQPYYETTEAPGKVAEVGDGWVTYQTGERSFKTVIGGVARTYVDEAGKVQAVDDDLVPAAGSGVFVNAANDFAVEIPAVIADGAGVTFAKDGYQMTVAPVGGDYSRPVAKANAVLFNDVFPGVDVQYTVVGQVVKEDIVLNRVVDQSSFQSQVSVTEDLAVGWEFGALSARATVGRGEIEAGDVVFTLSAPALFDAAGSFSDAITLTADGSGRSSLVTITPSPEWLQASERVYPVRIDPTVDLAPGAVTLVGVEQGAPDMRIGDNGYPYSGYDDGVVSGNIRLYNTAHLMTRTYAAINYDFSNIMREGRIDSASFQLHHYTNWGASARSPITAATFGLYTVDQAWDPATITWNNQLFHSHTYLGQTAAVASRGGGYLAWDVRELVNNWVQGIGDNNGFVVKATDERWMQAEVFSNKSSANPPKLEIDWSIPDPVDLAWPLADVTVNARPVTDKSIDGKLTFGSVFADGMAQPDSYVNFQLEPSDDPAWSGVMQASRSYRFPNTSEWDTEWPPSVTKYADKLSNWQSGLYGPLGFDQEYWFTAKAFAGVDQSPEKTSDRFLIYQLKAQDTLPFVAKYYGVPLDTLMRDNRVQDTLLAPNNTIFVRNPNTTVPYSTPSTLTEEQKRQIDSNLMGRGLHCEYGMEPVNLNTGDFWVEEIDIQIPDVAGTTFGLTRNYNSLGDQIRSIFGFGWQSQYSQYIYSADNQTDLLYVSPDGKTVTFRPNGDGTYSSPEGFYSTLTAIPYVQAVDGVDQTFTRYELTAADGSVIQFNAWGLVSAFVAANGQVTTLTYDANYNLTQVTSPSGLALTFGYDNHGRVGSVTRPDGVSLGYAYDDRGDLVTYTDGNGHQVRYVYDEAHRMVEWYDQNGTRQVANTYDAIGRVTAQVDANGQTSTLAFSAGRTQATDGRGLTTTYLLDDQQRTAGILYPDGSRVSRSYGPGNVLVANETGSYGYDAEGNQTASTDAEGRTLTRSFNAAGQQTQSTDAAGTVVDQVFVAGDLVSRTTPAGTEAWTYDGLHRPVTHTTVLGGTETYGYDGTRALPSTFTDVLGNTWRFDYNPMNQVTATTDPTGAVTRYTYDRQGVETGVQAADGGFTQYVLDLVGRPLQTVDPTGAVTSFTYDGLSNVTQVVDPLGATSRFTYDANGNLTGEVNGLGETASHVFDGRDRQVSSTDPAGGQWTYQWDDQDRLTAVTDPAGATTTYTVDQGLGTLLTETDALGRTTSYSYTPTGAVASVTAPDGGVTAYNYDAAGRLEELSEPGGQRTRFSYDAAGNITSLDVNGRVTHYRYDLAGNLIGTTDAAGNQASYTYDAVGRLLRGVNEAGQVTANTWDGVGRQISQSNGLGTVQFTYDLAGNPVTVTDANGHTTAYTYDAMNHQTSQTDATGAVTTYGWDAAERLIEMTGPYGDKTRYDYDRLGQLTAVTDPLGRVTRYEWDAAGRATRETDPAGGVTSRAYDLVGQLTELTEANGRRSQFSYDQAGRLTELTTNTGVKETYGYDAAGRLVTATDPVGRTAQTSYNVWGEITAETSFDQDQVSYEYNSLGFPIAATSAAGGTVRYGYNPVGGMTSQTDAAGSTWTYQLDAAGHVVAATDPAHGVTRYTWDPVGNLTRQTDPLGQTTGYAWDAANRLLATTDANGATTTQTWDAAGRLATVTRPEGDVTRYTYDLAGQLTGVTDANGAVTAYAYDPRGQVARLTDPLAGVTAYTWDPVGNLTSETDPLGRTTTYEYSLDSQLTSLTQPNEGQFEYTWDAADRLTSVTSPLGYRRQFTYNQAGDITTETDSLGRSSHYQWDGLHNLVTSTDAAGAVSQFVWDQLGRLTLAVDAEGGETAYQWDVLGRLTEETDAVGGQWQYTWDAVGRQTAMTAPDGAVTTTAYDPVGNVTATTDGLGQTTRYAYDTNNRLTEVTDASGQRQQLAWNGLDQITRLTDQRGAQINYGYDLMGNQTSLTDANGNETSYVFDAASQLTSVTDPAGETWSYDRDEMGNVTQITDPLDRVTEYSWDAESNLTSVTSPTGAVEQWSYDPASRVVETIKPGGQNTLYDWDEVNNLVAVTYPGVTGQDVQFGYDQLGQMVAMADATGQSSYQYDGLGRLTSATQGDGRTVTYDWDPNGQVGAIGYPDGTTVEYGYDAAGNLVSVTDVTGTSTYSYDDTNRVIELVRPDGLTTTYAYDDRSAVVAIEHTTAGGELVARYDYAYDDAGLITAETQIAANAAEPADSVVNALVSGGLVAVTRVFTYDDNDRLLSYTETEPAPVAADGRRLAPVNPAVEPAQVTYEYDAAGNRTGVTRKTAGDVTVEQVTYQYDDDDRLVSADSTLNGVTTYTYGPSGSLIAAENTDTGATEYAYTADERLRAVRQGGRLLMAATYDGLGNRVFQLSARPVELTAGFRADTGRDGSPLTITDDELITSVGGVFWYGFAQQLAQQTVGVNGGLTVFVMTGLHEQWGHGEVRLPRETGLDQRDLGALENAGLTASDVDDLVTGSTVSVVIPDIQVDLDGWTFDLVHYVNDINQTNPQVLSTYGESGQLAASYTYGLDRLNVRSTGASATTSWLESGGSAGQPAGLFGSTGGTGQAATGWYLADGRGSAAQVVSAGRVAQQTSFDPFGAPSRQVGATSSPAFGFTGEEYNPVTGLEYLRARYLDVATSRFTSQDTVLGDVASPGTLNRYLYALSDPVNRLDPSGHFSFGGLWNSVKQTASKAVSWVNTNVVQPVVNTVKTAANWVNQNVIQPVVNWVDRTVVQPVRNVWSQATQTVTNTVQTVYDGVSSAVDWASQKVVETYRSTTEYVNQRTAEIKQKVIEFACSTADKLTDAWEKAKDVFDSIPWEKVGQVALIVAGTALGAVLTVATAGAAGPLAAALLYAGLAASTVFAANDVIEVVTGDNLIRDHVMGGNQTLYDTVSLATGLLGGIDPSDVTKVVSQSDNIARLADDAIEAVTKTGDDLVEAGGKQLDDVADSGSNVTRQADEAPTPNSADGCSFTAVTLVLMADGTSKPIGDVRVGDQVQTMDPATGQQVVGTVTATLPHTDDTVTLTFSDNSVIESTDEHPWWVPSQRAFIRTDHLTIGDQLLAADGQTVTVTNIEAAADDQPVFDLTVNGTHTFYVGTTPLLVHNCPRKTSTDQPAQITQNKANGAAAEETVVSNNPGSRSQVTMVTSEGTRRIDVLTATGTQIEVKTGRVPLTQTTSKQVSKDVAAMSENSDEIVETVWEFFPSPVTGQGGPTGPLRSLLESEGIKIVVHE